MLAAIDAALERIDAGTYGTCMTCGKPIGDDRLEAIPYATSASTAAAERSGADRASPTTHARPPGDESRRDGLAAVSVAERSLSAEGAQWLSLALVAAAAVAADQVTKHIVSSQLALDDEIEIVGPLSIHHVQNSGIAFGLFPDATAAVIAITSVAVGWMLVFFARAGARIPCCPLHSGC